MLNYIKADLYRIFTKKSFYMYYAFIMVIILSITILANASANSHLEMAGTFISAFLPMSIVFFGINIFLVVYGDDLANKSLSLVFSTGLSRVKFVLSKLIIFILTLIAVYSVMGLFGLLIWQLSVGTLPALNSAAVVMTLRGVVITALVVIATASVAAILGYFFQKSTASIILYAVIALGLSHQIVVLLSNVLKLPKEIAEHMIYSLGAYQSYSITEGKAVDIKLFIVALIYVLVGITLQTVILSKKEINGN